jgi:hypothetical protein
MDNPTDEEALIDFINATLGLQLTLSTPASEIKLRLEEIITLREQELTEDGIDHDDWGDDEIIGQIQDYIDDLPNLKFFDISMSTGGPGIGGKLKKSKKRKSKKRKPKKKKRKTRKTRKT